MLENKHLVLLFSFLVVTGIGAVGYRFSLEGTILQHVLRSLKLFTLTTELPQPTHFLLLVARLVAPAVTSATLIGVYLSVSHKQLRGQWLRARARNHVVVCGLGRKGMQVVQRHLDSGTRVIVIELDAGNKYLADLKSRRATVLIGDATSAEKLKKARVDRAGFVYALTGSEEVNVSIASMLKEELSGKGKPGSGSTKGHLVCFVHFASPVTKRSCEFNLLEDRFSILEFNIFEEGARRLRLGYLTKHYVTAGTDRYRAPGGAPDLCLVAGSGTAAACLVRELLQDKRRVLWVRTASDIQRGTDPQAILDCRVPSPMVETVADVVECLSLLRRHQQVSVAYFLLADDDATNLHLAQCLSDGQEWEKETLRLVIGTTRPKVARRLFDERTGRARPGWGTGGKGRARVYVFDYLDPSFAANVKSSLARKDVTILASRDMSLEQFKEGFQLLEVGLRHPLEEVRAEALGQMLGVLGELERGCETDADAPLAGIEEKIRCAVGVLARSYGEYVREITLRRIVALLLDKKHSEHARARDMLYLAARLVADFYDTPIFRVQIEERILQALVGGFLEKWYVRPKGLRFLGRRLLVKSVNGFYWGKEGLPCDYLEMLFFLRDASRKGHLLRKNQALASQYQRPEPDFYAVLEDPALFPAEGSTKEENGLIAWYLYSILPVLILSPLKGTGLRLSDGERSALQRRLDLLEREYQRGSAEAQYIVQRTFWVLAYLVPSGDLRDVARPYYQANAIDYLKKNGFHLTYTHDTTGVDGDARSLLDRYVDQPFKVVECQRKDRHPCDTCPAGQTKSFGVHRYWVDRGVRSLTVEFATHRLQEYLHYALDPENGLGGDAERFQETCKLLEALVSEPPSRANTGTVTVEDPQAAAAQRFCHVLDALGEVGVVHPGRALRMLRDLIASRKGLLGKRTFLGHEPDATPAMIAARAFARIYGAHPGDARACLEDLLAGVGGEVESHLDLSRTPPPRFEAAHLGDKVYQSFLLYDDRLRIAFGKGMAEAAGARNVRGLFRAFVEALDTELRQRYGGKAPDRSGSEDKNAAC